MSPEMLAMLSIAGIAAVGFFAWLGTSVVGVKLAVKGIETKLEMMLGPLTALAAKAAGEVKPAPPPATPEAADIAADAADSVVAVGAAKAGEIRKAPKK